MCVCVCVLVCVCVYVCEGGGGVRMYENVSVYESGHTRMIVELSTHEVKHAGVTGYLLCVGGGGRVCVCMYENV